MKSERPQRNLLFAIAATIACILQLYGTIRYIDRLPDDTVGVVLYIVTCVLFGAVAAGHYVRWAGERKRTSGEHAG